MATRRAKQTPFAIHTRLHPDSCFLNPNNRKIKEKSLRKALSLFRNFAWLCACA
jgi:hypothetical protein